MRIFGHGGDFSWQAQGKPHVFVVHRRLFVTGVAQGIGAALLRSADLILWQAHALDMVVIFEAL